MDKDKSYRFLLPTELFEAAMAKAKREDLTLAQVLRRFLMAWVTGGVELPLQTEFREEQLEQE